MASPPVVRVLLVEDDEDDYLLTRELLREIEGARFEVEWARSYDTARERIRAGAHDVYLFDYRLGGHTGVELLRDVKESGSPVPVILLTGQGDHEVDVDAMRAGAADYLVKGQIDPALLERSIRYAIERARLLQSEREAVRARDEVLRIVSHDLGNSLSAIVVNAMVLARTLPEGEARERAADIRGIAEQTQRLRQDLLDVARIEAGRLPVEPEVQGAAEIAEEAHRHFAPVAAESGVELSYRAASDLPPVWADRGRVLQVLANLVGNAVKFTPAGGRVTLGLRASDGDLLFSVRDTGPGIPPEELPHVFDRFWQARHARRGGAGLGLAIARGIVEAHGGRMWAESTPGEGSTFSFTLPAAPEEEPPL